MGKLLIEGSSLTNIADAIRTKTASADKYKVEDMPQAILDIQSGGSDNPPEPLTITKNGGTYSSPDGFSPVPVDVPAL